MPTDPKNLDQKLQILDRELRREESLPKREQATGEIRFLQQERARTQLDLHKAANQLLRKNGFRASGSKRGRKIPGL